MAGGFVGELFCVVEGEGAVGGRVVVGGREVRGVMCFSGGRPAGVTGSRIVSD